MPQATRDNGVILVYIKFVANTWFQVPQYITVLDRFVVTNIGATNLVLQVRNKDFSAVAANIDIQGLNAIKVLAIPPGTTPTTIGKIALPDYNNYEETMKYYGLSVN